MFEHRTSPQLTEHSRLDVEILGKEEAFHGYFRINRYQLRHRRFDDSWSKPLYRELFERGHAAAVLPYDPDLDQVVLIEQFRPGAMETTPNPWLLEIVAGIIEAGETAEEVARREAVEEAGISFSDCTKITSFLVSPGGTTERIDLFLGIVDARTAAGVHGLGSEDEDIRVIVMDREEAYQLVQQGRIDNATALIALQWLQLNYQRYRKS